MLFKEQKTIIGQRAIASHQALLLLVVLAVGVAAGFGLNSLIGSGDMEAPATKQANQGPKTLYTCGMCPEIIEDVPGMCPKCGMKLVPMDKGRASLILKARGETVSSGGGGERKISYWRAPMDPAYIRNEPGKSPMGMDLVPVYEDDVSGGPSIRIDPATEQNMGLRYDMVRVGPVEKTVRTVGAVAYDEQGLATVTTKIAGWVEQVYVDLTGTQVHQGDPLFELYSPELYNTQKDYLVALNDLQKAEAGGLDSAAELARNRLSLAKGRLELFDISAQQIEQLNQERELSKTMTITAQATGIVTHKNIVQGLHLKAGDPAYQIADLSTVWVIGKVFESDLPYISLGQEAQMQLDYLPGRVYSGRVTYIYPYLEPGAREVPVRMEFHNPGYDLKPGMYVTIELQSTIAEQAVLAPAMAIIDTGERKVAFVTKEAGKFEPRRVTTGVRTQTDELQILSGLAPGEKVVVSGQFLLDSESRLREATLKMLKPGMVNSSDVLEIGEPDEAPGGAGVSAATAMGPAKYVCPMPGHAGILYDEPGDCPLCPMKLVPVQAWQRDQSPVHHFTCPMPEHFDVIEQAPGKCPKCGMTLIPVTEEEVERFAQVAKDALPKSLYTCPMPVHAHVVSDEPGVCPECNMKLVPTTSVQHGKLSEEFWRHDHRPTQTLTLYTCEMEECGVVSDKPGICPECGMVLVPTSTVPHGKKAEEQWYKEHPETKTLVLYTCDMEECGVVFDKPGICPECGMVLVPTSTVPHGAEAEKAWREKKDKL